MYKHINYSNIFSLLVHLKLHRTYSAKFAFRRCDDDFAYAELFKSIFPPALFCSEFEQCMYVICENTLRRSLVQWMSFVPFSTGHRHFSMKTLSSSDRRTWIEIEIDNEMWILLFLTHFVFKHTTQPIQKGLNGRDLKKLYKTSTEINDLRFEIKMKLQWKEENVSSRFWFMAYNSRSWQMNKMSEWVSERKKR